jgi:hypothetical protein
VSPTTLISFWECDIVVSSALLAFALGLDRGGAECGLRAVSIANCAHAYQRAMSS